MGFPLLTGEQSLKALHYSIQWLEQETKEIAKAIENCSDEATKKLLIQRKAELDRDYAAFLELNA